MEQKETHLRAELTELTERLNDPAIFSSKDYPKIAKRRQELEHTVKLFTERAQLLKSQTEATELAAGDDAEMAELAASELEERPKTRMTSVMWLSKYGQPPVVTKPVYSLPSSTACIFAGQNGTALR
jgi:protein subunit release factor A